MMDGQYFSTAHAMAFACRSGYHLFRAGAQMGVLYTVVPLVR